MKVLIEKSIEYNKPLILIFGDYEKIFNTINKQIMLQSLSEARLDHKYTTIIKNIYRNAKATVRLHADTADFPIEREVRQGDVISPKLFATLMEIWALI